MVRFICIVCLIIALVATVVGWSWHQVHRPLSLASTRLVTLERGEAAQQVAAKLINDRVTTVPLLVIKAWLKLGLLPSTVKAGTYQLSPQMQLRDAFALFASGEEYQFTVSLIEGLTYVQWIKMLREQDYLTDDIDGDLQSELLAAWPFALPSDVTTAEGLLLAETYHFTAKTKMSTLLTRAMKAMSNYLENEWQERDVGLPYASSYEVLIMASIIEKETAVADERPLIAGVFVNRLAAGMRLQTDPTVIYGLGDAFDGNLTRAHLQEMTPYNTYRINGLPPTPIAMPGKAAIHAALHPSLTDHIYFVSKGDGTHHFSATLEEHNRAVNQYQRQGND